MTAAQTAPAPTDLSWLQGLPEGVSYVALGTIIFLTAMFYLGPALRARFMPKTAVKPDTPAAAPAAPVLAPPALGPAIDQAERMASEYIAFLKGQLDARDRQLDAKDRRQVELERRIDELESDLRRRG